ncbi:hypothetical protein AAEX28_08425 [Lentisphaerota bacterium WC36G]|nr:hypothetical protein LJT99_11280 [Lentisphaerae bacterium WC36]
MTVKKDNFTLVELFIILAIILILTTLLIPILVAVKEKANTSNCTDNQKRAGYYLSMAKNDIGKIINGSSKTPWAGVLSANFYDQNNNNIGLGYFQHNDTNFLHCIKNKTLQSNNLSKSYEFRNTFGMQGPDNITHKYWTASIDGHYLDATNKTISKEYLNTINGALYVDKYPESSNTMLIIDSKYIEGNTESLFNIHRSEYLIRYQNSNEYMHSEQRGTAYLAHQDSLNALFSDLHVNTINRYQLDKIIYKKNNICFDQNGAMKSISRGLYLYEVFIKNEDGDDIILKLENQ